MVNPIHGLRTEPVDAAAANPGEIGFMPIVLNADNIGYHITGVAEVAGGTTFRIWGGYPEDDYKSPWQR